MISYDEPVKPCLQKINDLTYILLISLNQPCEIQIGKLGRIFFKSGYYLYVGSAKKAIEKRINRHLKRQKNKFWHIDYLLSDPYPSKVVGVWTHNEFSECFVAQRLLENNHCSVVKKGFGSSDCKCTSHFFRVHRCYIDILLRELSQMQFNSWIEK